MCGLVSIITKSRNGFQKDQVDAFRDLLFIDQLRGMDSTGMFLVSNSGELELAKEASHATDFLLRKEPGELLGKAFRCGAALVGHNRSATKGSITDENAHPFVVDDRITLVHNGTLWGDHTKLADTKVDSHAIAHVIHESGDDVEAALSKINGAFALIWHDFKNRTVNFVRNSQRPLHWVETTSGWVWASEANMIEWVLARHTMKAMGDISLLPVNCLCFFTQENGSWSINTKDLKLTPPITAYVPTYYNPAAHHHRRSSHHNPYGVVDYEDDAYDLLKQQLEVTDTRGQGTLPTPVPMTHLSQENLTKREDQLALKMGCHMTWLKWNAITEAYKQNELHTIKCFDFLPINEFNPKAGYFLYGTLESDPDLLVRIHVALDTETENKLLDWTVNETLCVVKLGVKSWKVYSDKSLQNGVAGDGWGVFTGMDIRELIITEA